MIFTTERKQGLRRILAPYAKFLTQRKIQSSISANSPRPAPIIPDHWWTNDWEEKAKENPLYAVMTVPDLAKAQSESFTAAQLVEFFKKGSEIYEQHLKRWIKTDGQNADGAFVVEYGCGMGRILKTLVANGIPCAGIDISPTMLRHCRALVPEVQSLHLVDPEGRCDLPERCASVVFSYSVFQHVSMLSAYLAALKECCRVLKPGGYVVLQINCEDFVDGFDAPRRTVNFENHSLHYREGNDEPYKRHDNSTWSGVYIGEWLLRETLKEEGVHIFRYALHNANKRQAIWCIGRKGGT